MTIRHSALTLAGSALSVVLLTSCGSSTQDATGTSPAATSSPAAPSASASESASASPSPSEPAAAAPVVITIKDFKYEVPESVAPGAQVTVVNEDSQNHTVTLKGSKAFDATATARGGKATFTAPTEPGEYPFICTFHGNMNAVLVVK